MDGSCIQLYFIVWSLAIGKSLKSIGMPESIYIGIGKHCRHYQSIFLSWLEMTRKISNKYNDNNFYSSVKCSRTKRN